MSAAFLQAIKARRTYYALSKASPIPDEKLKAIVDAAIHDVPSAFNMQAGRAVLLTGKSNDKLWEIVKTGYLATLGGNEDAIKTSTQKIAEYGAGYGSVMFFEDQTTIAALSAKLAAMAPHFPIWSENSTGMIQFAVWTALEAEGLGASLQHHAGYAPAIASGIAEAFNLPAAWKCTALMPFGVPTGPPGNAAREKTFLPLEERVKYFN